MQYCIFIHFLRKTIEQLFCSYAQKKYFSNEEKNFSALGK